MKKIVLTGASGFVGRQCLSPLVRHGYEIHAVQHQHRAPDIAQVQWHQVDLLDADEVSRFLKRIQPTHLLHCAWYAVPGKYWEAVENYRWVEASQHLFRSFVKLGGQRAVGVGSCAEYDWSFTRCLEYSTPLNPATTYGTCKVQVGTFLEELGNKTGVTTAWGRLFFLYGPHERPERFVPSIINPILRGERARCSHGEHVRDYIYVKDAADALASLLASSVSGPVNIASGKAVALKQIAKTIGAKLGRPDLLTFAETESTGAREIAAETARLNREVGWSPKYNLDLGLEETIGWWQLNQ
jgi:nucleoside-diphosphate-sugar epimerase